MNINVHVWMCVHAHSWVCVSHLCVWVCAFAACIWKSEDNLGCFFLQVPFAFDLLQGLSLEMDFVHRSGHQAPALPEILLSLPTLSEPHFILYGSWGFELRCSHVQDQHFTNWAISPTHLFAVFCSKICTWIDVKLSAFLITSCRVNIYVHSCRTVNMSGSAILAQVLHGRTHGMVLNTSDSDSL